MAVQAETGAEPSGTGWRTGRPGRRPPAYVALLPLALVAFVVIRALLS